MAVGNLNRRRAIRCEKAPKALPWQAVLGFPRYLFLQQTQCGHLHFLDGLPLWLLAQNATLYRLSYGENVPAVGGGVQGAADAQDRNTELFGSGLPVAQEPARVQLYRQMEVRAWQIRWAVCHAWGESPGREGRLR